VELENQLHISQLETLKAQLNPHFLFNALHALHTLIGYDDNKAKSMTIKISSLLRKILDQKDKHMVTLEEELDYLKDYLEIEQERFHDRLSINFDIQEDTKSLMVPNLILQPLAENAFKHGISLVEGEGVISLSSLMKDNLLLIEMSNTLPKGNKSSNIKSTRLGLSNLRNRLEQLYGDDYDLKTERKEDNFKVTVIMNTTSKA
jgi:LytS/YehU family sensor histidine kinase